MQSSDSDTANSDSEVCVQQGRKRIKNVEKWQSRQRKHARLAGKSYTSTSGKVVQSKKTGPPCLCRRKCTDNFPEEVKSHIIVKLYAGQPKNEQDTFLVSLIEVKPCKKRRKQPENDNSHKNNTFSFFAMNENNERQTVCKKAFMSLHALSHHQVQRLSQLAATGESPRDKRGQHSTRPHVLSTAILTKINSHIASFPQKQTHYNSKIMFYLDASLTVKSMHSLFLKKYPELENKVKYEFYLRYFNENFSLRFGRPQVDVCSTCEELGTKLKNSNLNDNAKRVAAAELMVHKRRAKKFYNKIQEIQRLCQNDPEVAGIAFDFMQNLPLPNIPVQEIFYYRQLWVYLFEIHNLKDDTGFFYTYHEGQAKKSPDEVCSFLYDYIQNQIPRNVKVLHIFSDGCPGQNRNNTMVRFLLGLQATKRFSKIHHYFPIRGHSFLPCDRDFGTLKRLVRKHDRVYVPEEYENMILKCRISKPFQLKTVTFQNITNYKDWWPQYYKKTCRSVETKNKETFTVSKYRHFIYDAATEGCVTVSQFIDGALFSTYRLMKPNVTPQLPNSKAYSEPVPLNEKKVKDLRKILQYIMGEELEFYYHIVSWKTTSSETSE